VGFGLVGGAGWRAIVGLQERTSRLGCSLGAELSVGHASLRKWTSRGTCLCCSYIYSADVWYSKVLLALFATGYRTTRRATPALIIRHVQRVTPYDHPNSKKRSGSRPRLAGATAQNRNDMIL
jgi:hypothetical protein